MTKEPSVDEAVIRPSMKLIRVGYTSVFIILFVCVMAYANSSAAQTTPAWVAFLPALLFLWPLKYHLRNHFTRMVLSGDRLRYETGILSRSKRAIQLSNVQNVRVEQTLAQRMLRIGNISVETAGETSLLTMPNVDNPDQVTEAILAAAHKRPADRSASQPKG